HHSLLLFSSNDTPTTDIYTLSLHDALPISQSKNPAHRASRAISPRSLSPQHQHRASPSAPPSHASHRSQPADSAPHDTRATQARSEEHTSELQSLAYLVCRLLLEKKKQNNQ